MRPTRQCPTYSNPDVCMKTLGAETSGCVDTEGRSLGIPQEVAISKAKERPQKNTQLDYTLSVKLQPPEWRKLCCYAAELMDTAACPFHVPGSTCNPGDP